MATLDHLSPKRLVSYRFQFLHAFLSNALLSTKFWSPLHYMSVSFVCYITCNVMCSCGSCGYELNLHSSDRDTTNIDSKYGKAIKKGIVSLVAIDGSRLSETDYVGCVPYFASANHLFDIFRQRTKLVCRESEAISLVSLMTRAPEARKGRSTMWGLVHCSHRAAVLPWHERLKSICMCIACIYLCM